MLCSVRHAVAVCADQSDADLQVTPVAEIEKCKCRPT